MFHGQSDSQYFYRLELHKAWLFGEQKFSILHILIENFKKGKWTLEN